MDIAGFNVEILYFRMLLLSQLSVLMCHGLTGMFQEKRFHQMQPGQVLMERLKVGEPTGGARVKIQYPCWPRIEPCRSFSSSTFILSNNNHL